MKFDRFRAYAASEATRHRTARTRKGKRVRVARKPWPVEDVAFEGEASGDGSLAAFDAGKTEIARVVFYAGDPEHEAVVGSVEVGKAGKISVACPDADDDDDDEVIGEDEEEALAEGEA